MPGSRRGEIRQHLDMQLEVARRLYKNHPHVRVLLMCAPSVDKEALQDKLADVRFPIMVQKDDPFEMIHLADFVLAASGTATLMVGLLEKPMVIMYRMKWITGVIAKLLVRGVKHFGIVNLILGHEVVPERWQEGANVEELYQLMSRYLEDPAYTEGVRGDLRKIRNQLGSQGATRRVAEGLKKYFSKVQA
jgi:lipid-A-disaccharide synthase